MRSGRLGGGPRRENCNAARQTAWRLMLEEVIMQEISHRILDEVKKTVIGKDAVVRKVYMAILAGGHILLEDIPGVGKTTLALAFAGAMDLRFRRLQRHRIRRLRRLAVGQPRPCPRRKRRRPLPRHALVAL